MKLLRSEFQVEEMNQVVAQKREEGGWDTSNDDVQLKIQLSTLEAMNNELTNQLKDEKGARRMVEGKNEKLVWRWNAQSSTRVFIVCHIDFQITWGVIIKELNNLKKSFEISEKERSEAVTKLQVLADYFNNEKTKMHKYDIVNELRGVRANDFSYKTCFRIVQRNGG